MFNRSTIVCLVLVSSLLAACAGDETLELVDDSELAAQSGLAALLSEQQFNSFFPDRLAFYKYSDLVAASALIPGFASTGNAQTRKRELAAFLANVAQESGYLQYVEEINKQNVYCDPQPGCGCPKTYYGRGPLQLSWNTNYCAAGKWLGRDYLDHPELLHKNPVDSWRASMWFWMTQAGAGTTSPHDAMVKGLGFGETIRAINGALECQNRSPDKVANRVKAYKRFANELGVSPGPNLDCRGPAPSAPPAPGGWIDMTRNDRACDGHIGQKCGWAPSDNGEGYRCKDMGEWTSCSPG